MHNGMSKFKTLIVGLLLVVLVVPVVGCASISSAETIFTGTLVDAQGERITVRGETETILFETTNQTVYNLHEGESKMCVGDEVKVEYHKTSAKYVADMVTVSEHEEELLVIGGEITDLTDRTMTLTTESLTVRFAYNEKTKIEGNLNKGDLVTVTYKGDLNEDPYAVSIIVIEERQQASLNRASGTICEVGRKSILLSVDSATAYRFVVNEDTIITGADMKMKVGDKAAVVYTGDIKNEPVARSIELTRPEDRHYYVMNGVFVKATRDELVVETQKDKYYFLITDGMTITNEKYYKQGHEVTVTYTGKLGKDAEAVAVYCSKKVIEKKEKKTTKKTTEKTDPTKKTKATEVTKESEETDPTEDTDITDPTEDTDPTDPTEDTDPTDPTEETDPTDVTDETDATDATEPSAEEPETQPEDQGDQGTPEDSTDVIVQANGTIEKWDKTCSIKVEGGGTVSLDISDAAISSGYFPMKGDQVVIAYDKSDMKLLDIQLAYRPVQEGDSTDEGGVSE